MNPSSEQVQNNGGEDGKDCNILDYLPTGMVFAPTDDELIVYYLMNKIQNQPLPPNKIEVVNIYAFDPDQLPGIYIYIHVIIYMHYSSFTACMLPYFT